ncbi:MAG: ATP-dependent Clp protease adaptor ClpS [Fulvivirga sp.]|uniref:ATP-dependent Clp protease adaptor ClpS n=1 Tax=Fulvivirga sp. TaxID=1931237 RepID=UPI0032EFF6B9
MDFGYNYEEEVEVLEEVEIVDNKSLVVYNDDVNTFDHVINTLVKVCQHTVEQAEQCAWIIHYKGKCIVKTGSFKELKPKQEAICEKGIDARVH